MTKKTRLKKKAPEPSKVVESSLRKKTNIKRIRTASLVLFSVMLFATLLVPTALAADSSYYSHLSDEQIREIFSLETNDIPNAFRWINDSETFVIIEDKNADNDGDGEDDLVYWWNTPNLQMTFYNLLYDQLALSGYGNTVGESAKEHADLVELPESDEAKSAMERYGFSLQNPAYVGERPLVTISVLGVLLPDNVLDGIGRFVSLIFGGEIVGLPTDDDLQTLTYVAPHDYDTSGSTFKTWVEKNWDDIVRASGDGSDKSLSEPGNLGIYQGQVLLGLADDEGMYQEKQWTADNILYRSGLMQEGLSADYVCSQLELLCGKYYSQVAEGIIISSGAEQTVGFSRQMPYDLTRMNVTDRELFDGIDDPRSLMQENLLSTGYWNIVPNVAANLLLDHSGSMAELAVFLNNLASFEVLETVGFDPLTLWSQPIMLFLQLVVLVTLVFLCAKSAVFVVSGKYSGWKLVQRLLVTMLVALLSYGLTVRPESTYGTFKNIASDVLSLGNATFEWSEQLETLYGTSEGNDKEAVNLWLPYFNMWTLYQTNHALMDEEQSIESSEGPEMDELKVPEIDGVQQDMWSTVLADAATSHNQTYSGNVYRMVDHFMAPRITMNDPETLDFDVNENENYNGFIQSNINWAVLPAQWLLIAVVFIKVLLFLEMMINVALLFVRFALAASDKGNLVYTVKQLCASVVNVMMCNMVCSLIIWMTLLSEGAILLILVLFMAICLWQVLKHLVLSNGPFSPNIIKIPLRFFMRMWYGIVAKFATSRVGRRDTEIPEDYDEHENMHEDDLKEPSEDLDLDEEDDHDGVNDGEQRPQSGMKPETSGDRR